jgi:hypothetical protein
LQELQSVQGNSVSLSCYWYRQFLFGFWYIIPIHLGLECAHPSEVQRLCLPRRWKYENWSISRRLTCPWSTRYGHRHRQNKNKSCSSTPRISLPISVLDLEIKKETLNRPSLSSKMQPYLKDRTCIVSSSLVLWIMM